MSCFDKEILQEYIDSELDDDTAVRLNTHLLECRYCRELLEEVKSDRDLALEFLSQLNNDEDSLSIPPPPIQTPRTHSPRIKMPKYLQAAAGIALIMGLFWILRNNSSPESQVFNEAELLYLEQIGDIEPNKSWHDGQALILYTDDEGKVIQSFSNAD